MLLATKSANNFEPIGDPVYIEDVFSTYLYTGNGSSQTINNGLNLATKGGMTWLKSRSVIQNNYLFDTNRGPLNYLISESISASTSLANSLTSFNNNGFSLGSASQINTNATTYASWTFCQQPKFFDVVTYTGNGNSQTIAHNLNSTPGCIFVKKTSSTNQWPVYHKSLGSNKHVWLNATNTPLTSTTIWNNQTPNNNSFYVGANTNSNESGQTYIAYLFADNAGGFGENYDENVITCGTFTGTGTAVNLGYEPQFVFIKSTSTTSNSLIIDNMRGFTTDGNDALLFPNTSFAESNTTSYKITSTGFVTLSPSSYTGIYIAIRRPMKTPTTGTQVFAPTLQVGSNTATNPTYPTNFPVDLMIRAIRTGGSTSYPMTMDRLRGSSPYLTTSSSSAETADTTWKFDSMTGVYAPTSGVNTALIGWLMRRAAGFFDVVCYTGTGSARTVNHNLGVAPELIIAKDRSSSSNQWLVYSKTLGADYSLSLSLANAQIPNSTWPAWNNTNPTASVFSLGTDSHGNGSGLNYVAYLFATVAGVSKVGSYTGTGATLSINAGFTTGARFVMIKRTDSTGDWFVWDTTRGMVAGTDPRLALNLTAAESYANWVYAASSGFQIVTTDASVNASGGTYIYLAIA